MESTAPAHVGPCRQCTQALPQHPPRDHRTNSIYAPCQHPRRGLFREQYLSASQSLQHTGIYDNREVELL